MHWPRIKMKLVDIVSISARAARLFLVEGGHFGIIISIGRPAYHRRQNIFKAEEDEAVVVDKENRSAGAMRASIIKAIIVTIGLLLLLSLVASHFIY